MLDWDRIRIFHAVAEAGSFTKASDVLGLSQSAISRQISALEDELSTILFHRHARGLIRTEQGDLLFDTSRQVKQSMVDMQSRLTDSKSTPSGILRVNATMGMGATWLMRRVTEFNNLYPDIHVRVLATDTDLDLAMREADVGIRLTPPTQPDLVQRKLTEVHTHVYASKRYIEKNGEPKSPSELHKHRLIIYSSDPANQPPIHSLNWLLSIARNHAESDKLPTAALEINNAFGMLNATLSDYGIATLPDYLTVGNDDLVRLFPDIEGPSTTAYFVYPEELRHSRRVSIFRDYLVKKVSEQDIW